MTYAKKRSQAHDTSILLKNVFMEGPSVATENLMEVACVARVSASYVQLHQSTYLSTTTPAQVLGCYPKAFSR